MSCMSKLCIFSDLFKQSTKILDQNRTDVWILYHTTQLAFPLGWIRSVLCTHILPAPSSPHCFILQVRWADFVQLLANIHKGSFFGGLSACIFFLSFISDTGWTVTILKFSLNWFLLLKDTLWSLVSRLLYFMRCLLDEVIWVFQASSGGTSVSSVSCWGCCMCTYVLWCHRAWVTSLEL